MSLVNRRPFLQSMLATAVSMPAIATSRGAAAESPQLANRRFEIGAQQQRERVMAFFQSITGSLDAADVAGFLANFVQSSSTVFEDATTALSVTGYPAIAALFTNLLAAERAVVGAGRLFKLFYVTGDLDYGAVTERVDLKKVFHSTNGSTVQTMFDLDGGQIARFTEYSDSRELGQSDIIGPVDITGVGFPVGAIHPGGVPLSSTSLAPPGNLALATGITGKPSASQEMVQFVQQLQTAMRIGNVRDILSFFTPDAVYVNPLIHQGPVLYGNFDQTIQIEGLDFVAAFLASTLDVLPDCRGSTLVHIVGGSSGGGFEWKAGGQYASTGINRNGLSGCTSLDLFDWRIRRMSVKFDTFQLPITAYNAIRSALATAGVVDF